MLVTWKYYKNRRSIDVDRFLQSNGSPDFTGFCKLLLDRGVMPPKREDLEESLENYFRQKDEVNADKVRVEKRKPAPKKTRLGRKPAEVKPPAKTKTKAKVETKAKAEAKTAKKTGE